MESNARYKRERKKDSNTNIRIYFEVRATAIRPRLHTEGFSLCPHMTFHKGKSTEELQIQNLEYTTLTLTPLHEREQQSPLHKREHKTKMKIQLSDPMITNTILVILKYHKQIFLTKHDPIYRFRMIAQV